MDLQSLLEQVKSLIFNNPSTPHQPGHDPGGLIGQIEDIFGQHQTSQQQQGYGNIRPASEDPLGDPGDVGGYRQANTTTRTGGDPRFPNLRPASEDPLGDPADG